VDTAIESQSYLQPLAQPPRRVHTITDRFAMSNTYLIDEERVIVVDPGSALNAQLTLHYLQHFLHRPTTDIDLIVLTHLHADHSSGVEPLRKATKAPVACSIEALRQVEAWSSGENWGASSAYQRFTSPRLGEAFHRLDQFGPQYERQVQQIDIWLQDVNGLPNHLDWRVIASPGNAWESICLYNPFTYELISGDTLVTLEAGTVFVRGGRNRRQLYETVETLRSLKVYFLYPGHGRPVLSVNALARIEW
jgi:glyoxylase-like metal-dependent hydrolase (beta-lactamase superfamily II)